MEEDEYREFNIFLADINQENVSVLDSFNRNRKKLILSILILVLKIIAENSIYCHLQGVNETYKKGIKDMSNLVLVKFNQDMMVEPKESQVSVS